jgi:ABC-type Fe3+ transport system permease subunit
MAALQQINVSLEEAAQSLGASRLRAIRRIVAPLMSGGILAGFVISFITAAVELSDTIMLVSRDSQAPMSYGIYLYMQSPAGRGPGAGGDLVTSSWVIIMIAYAVRRLPYALRSCMAALQQVNVSLEEAAQSLGASRLRAIWRVVAPLMTSGILAGFVISFITAAVELSDTIMLVSKDSQAPMSYGIYLYMQNAAGRGPGAALGMVAVIVVGVGTYLSHWLIERASVRQRPARGEEQT